MAAFGDIVSLPAVAHLGHEAHLAHRGTGTSRSQDLTAGWGMTEVVARLSPCHGSLSCPVALGKFLPLSGFSVLVLGILFFLHQGLVFPGTEVGQI